MSQDPIELVDSVCRQQIIAIGHDWGKAFLSRMASFHPQRFSALLSLVVGAPRVNTAVDIDGVNVMTKELMDTKCPTTLSG